MAPLKGVNRVRKTDATGQRVERWYAWRGKAAPLILHESAVSDRVLDLKVAAAATAAGEKFFAIKAARKTPPKGELLGLIKQWTASPEFKMHADRTQKDYRSWIRAAENDLGTLPLSALKADGCRAAFLGWRNKYAETPARADHYASALSNCLRWARDQGHTSADPMRNWPWIYHPDRSEILYTAAEIEEVCKAAKDDVEFQVAVLLATYSGLRKCDLIRLPKTAIGESTIVRRTSKRGRVVHVPITVALRQVLDLCLAISPEDCLTVLSKNGRPWQYSTLDKAWAAYRLVAIGEMPSISGKRWHDMRGTFATSLHREGYEDDEVDRIMGWAKGNSEQTRAAYVSGGVVAHTAIARARRRFAAAKLSVRQD